MTQRERELPFTKLPDIKEIEGEEKSILNHKLWEKFNSSRKCEFQHITVEKKRWNMKNGYPFLKLKFIFGSWLVDKKLLKVSD